MNTKSTFSQFPGQRSANSPAFPIPRSTFAGYSRDFDFFKVLLEPPATTLSTSPIEPMITLLVRLSAARRFEVIGTAGPRVGHVKDAIIAKFKHRFEDVKADQLLLYRLDVGSSRTPLDPGGRKR